MYSVTKTYGHNLGLSSCFRQPGAKSHCRFLHGYALQISLTFDAEELDDDNWVIDFGGLKPVKQFLVDHFDHKLLIAETDPQKDELCALAGLGLADPIVLPAVGCESFAVFIYDHVLSWMCGTHSHDMSSRGLRLASVEVREHSANCATYYGDVK